MGDALGPAPAEGEEEDAELAKLRKEVRAELERARVPVAAAEEAYARADTLIRQFERLAKEGEESGTVMCIPLHSYLIGQPHRIGPFEEVLKHIANDGRAWIARAGEIVDAFREPGNA